MTADDVIGTLGLKPHPEGGYYAETHRIPSSGDQRSPGTAIYYLLGRGDRSHWHRVDATEIWHFYSGAALELSLSAGLGVESHVLGPDLSAGQRPQVIVPPGHWQSARSLGEWTLVGCTVSPGFEFSGFEMAAPDWKPAS
jgi:predicted cupin superfamily sugar epimerase